jgi:hypothetical protein
MKLLPIRLGNNIKLDMGRSIHIRIDFELIWSVSLYLENYINYPLLCLMIDPELK